MDSEFYIKNNSSLPQKKEKIIAGTAKILNDEIVLLENIDISAKLFNTTAKDTEGKTSRDLGYDEKIVKMWIDNIYLSEREESPIAFKYWRQINEKLYYLSNIVSFSKRLNSNEVIFHYFIQDITEQKTQTELLITEKQDLEEELSNFKSRQQLMLNSAQISTWDWDLTTGNIINQFNTEKVFGIPHSTRTFFFSRVHPDDLKEMTEKVNYSLQNKKPFTAYYRYIRPDTNETRWLESRGNVINNKILNIETLSGVTFDVTDKKEIDEQLHASRRQFQVLAETIPNFIWKSNKYGEVNYFNKSWYEYTGLDTAKSLGWNWVEAIHPDDRDIFLKFWRSKLLSGKTSDGIEIRVQSNKQKFKWYLWQTKPVTNNSNKVVKWFGSFTDIDAQKKLLESTQSSLRTRDEFISIASHELKTPLTSLRINLELLEGLVNRSSENTDKKIQKSIEISLKQVNQLSFLIENLLNISSIQNGLLSLTKEETNIAQLIHECLDHYKEPLKNAGCHLTSYLNTSVYCKIDAHKIEQVILNLLGNIVKYAPNTLVFIELKEVKNSIQILIQDHGPGIAKEKLERIFNRFERAHDKKSISGMGLGLYICKQLIEAHKGRIWAESEIQQGTKIYIELPIN